MPTPPPRLRMADELGSMKTLGDGFDVVKLAPGQDWLVLGLGPDPVALAASLPQDARVSYLECPDFLDRAGEAFLRSIPRGWTRVESFDPLGEHNIIFHNGAMRLFPSFWAHIGAALALPVPSTEPPAEGRTALIPAETSRLVGSEAADALRGLGYHVLEAGPGELLPILESCRPDLFLSINFAGLDPHGAFQAMLERAGVPVAVWCVDNPFHSLSGVKTLAWRRLHIFVTDSWFMKPLRDHGAMHVHHLPLAANAAFFQARADQPTLAGKLLFVGRSSFPGKNDFFAGLVPQRDAWAEALAMLKRGERPDFEWWVERIGLDSLWPGKQVRLAGLGAEESGLAWRSMVITESSRAGKLAVCGDEAWKELQNAAGASFEHLPPVDYYGPLAGMYASARCVIGATSPLLPHGLTQRHFDVWAAGGLLVTDNTPGLSIFPQELCEPVTYRGLSAIGEAIESAEADRESLIGGWRELIQREHTYEHRMATLREAISS